MVLHYRVQIGQQTSEKNKEYRVVFAELCNENLGNTFDFLQRTVSLKDCSFSFAECCKQAELQNLGLPTPRIFVLNTSELSSANGLVGYLQSWSKKPYHLTTLLYWRKIQKNATVLSVAETGQRPFGHDNSAEWHFFGLWVCGQTFLDH